MLSHLITFALGFAAGSLALGLGAHWCGYLRNTDELRRAQFKIITHRLLASQDARRKRSA